MYTKEQMEAKEAEVRKWREASEIYRETLRDRFAMAALPTMMSEFCGKGMSLHDVGAAAYDIADGMLQARDILRDTGK